MLKTVQARNQGRLKILAINAGDPPVKMSTSQAFRDAYHITYTILERPTPNMLAQYRLKSFPTFYLLDPSGTILWNHAGVLTESHAEEIRQKVQ